jgi:hypothetical protein
MTKKQKGQPAEENFPGTNFTVDQMGFIQIANSEILAAVARGELDLNAVARQELAARGLDKNGKWIGFDAARKLHLGGK